MSPLQIGPPPAGGFSALEQALGQLAWDLPARRTYTPNTDLPLTLKAANPTSAQRTYKLQLQALVGGQRVWYSDLQLQGQPDVWFPVPAGGVVTVQVTFRADRANFTLWALLIDQAANAVVASVATELTEAAASPAPTPAPTPPTQPTPGMDLTPLLSMLSLMLVMGLMTSLPKLFRRMGKKS